MWRLGKELVWERMIFAVSSGVLVEFFFLPIYFSTHTHTHPTPLLRMVLAIVVTDYPKIIVIITQYNNTISPTLDILRSCNLQYPLWESTTSVLHFLFPAPSKRQFPRALIGALYFCFCNESLSSLVKEWKKIITWWTHWRSTLIWHIRCLWNIKPHEISHGSQMC